MLGKCQTIILGTSQILFLKAYYRRHSLSPGRLANKLWGHSCCCNICAMDFYNGWAIFPDMKLKFWQLASKVHGWFSVSRPPYLIMGKNLEQLLGAFAHKLTKSGIIRRQLNHWLSGIFLCLSVSSTLSSSKLITKKLVFTCHGSWCYCIEMVKVDKLWLEDINLTKSSFGFN